MRAPVEIFFSWPFSPIFGKKYIARGEKWCFWAFLLKGLSQWTNPHSTYLPFFQSVDVVWLRFVILSIFKNLKVRVNLKRGVKLILTKSEKESNYKITLLRYLLICFGISIEGQ